MQSQGLALSPTFVRHCGILLACLLLAACNDPAQNGAPLKDAARPAAAEEDAPHHDTARKYQSAADATNQGVAGGASAAARHAAPAWLQCFPSSAIRSLVLDRLVADRGLEAIADGIVDAFCWGVSEGLWFSVLNYCRALSPFGLVEAVAAQVIEREREFASDRLVVCAAALRPVASWMSRTYGVNASRSWEWVGSFILQGSQPPEGDMLYDDERKMLAELGAAVVRLDAVRPH